MIPGSLVLCRGLNCRELVGDNAIPAMKVTGNPRSRGYFCEACAQRLGYPRPTKEEK